MFGKVPDTPPDAHVCDWPDCHEIGEHRAPHSPKDMKRFHMFCLEHIRQFNKSWNYYDGMSDEQVEASVRDDTSWNRPSWPFAGAERPLNFKGPTPDIDDFGGAFGDQDSYEGIGGASHRVEPDTPEAQALATLDLTPPVTQDDIKRRYKELVKRHHPDANGGDKDAEEKFKQISLAYATLTAEPVS